MINTPEGTDLRLAVLGPVQGTRAGVPIDLGGRRQRTVLALLVAARGQVVPADRLVDLVWDDEPPARPSGVLQAYVSHLRRALEPQRSARERTGLILSASPGYALRADAVAVDAWDFEAAVRRWTRPGVEPAAARDGLTAALGHWQGPPYADHPNAPWAVAERNRLVELRLLAREAVAGAQLNLGEAAAAVVDAEALASEHPLREEAWRLLALALYRAGRQGEALGALRRAREASADALGLDPGPALQALEADILAQAPHLLAPKTAPRPAAVQADRAVPDGGPRRLIGRDRELGLLDAAADRARGGVTVALVEGPAGSGKSALLDAVAARLEAEGWTTVRGQCPEVDGAPALYPWVTVLRGLGPRLAEVAGSEPVLAPLLAEDPGPQPGAAGDAAARRFQVHRAIARCLRAAAAPAPLLVGIDDLHRADDASLVLLRDLIGDLGTAPILLVATYRPGPARAELMEALAALSRADPVRVDIGLLSTVAVDELLSSLAGRVLTPRERAAAVQRCDGNPFHVTELARLLSAGGRIDEVPPGVRDVVRMRLSRLPDQTSTVLRVASVLGREVHTEVLLQACGFAEDAALDAVETAMVAGFLTADGSTGGVAGLRFSHILVRQAIYDALSPPRQARPHGHCADTFERDDPRAVSSLAHHHRLAGAGHEPATARWCARAAEQAERRHAYREAATLWRHGADAAHASAPPTPDAAAVAEQLGRLLRLIRALSWCGDVAQVRAVRAEAVELARTSGDAALLGAALTAWEVPTPWTQRHYLHVDRALIGMAETALASADDAGVRCRLLCLLVGELDGEGDPRVARWAVEAVAAAEETGDPQLLTLALNARLRACYENNDLITRLAVATRTAELGAAAELPTASMLGHQAAFAAFAGLGDLAAARAELTRLREVSDAHHLGTGQVMVLCAQALLGSLDGPAGSARTAVGDMVAAMHAAGEHTGDAMAAMCLFCVDELDAVPHDVAQVRSWYVALPRLSPEFLVRALVSQGHVDEARELWRPEEPVRADFLSLVVWAVRARNAIALGDRTTMRACRDALAPYQDQIVGASSGVLTLEPVARLLARLDAAVLA